MEKHPDHTPQIRAAQFAALHKQTLAIVIAPLFGAVLLVFGLADRIPIVVLAIWLAALAVFNLYGAVLYYFERRHELGPAVRLRFAVGASISGSLWGAAGIFMFVSDSSIHQTLLTLTLFAVVAGSVAILSVYLPVFYAFVVPAFIPIIVRTAWERDALHTWIAVVALVLFVAILLFGRRQGKIMEESMRLRFENIDLIAALTQQRDIAERAKEKAESANLAKSRFLAAASHDLRQPLHALGLYGAALTERIRYPEVRQIVDNINASVEALSSLFDALLDITKLDAGVITHNRKGFCMRALFTQMRRDYESEARAKGLRLRIVDTSLIVDSDERLLERILRNLISNAIRYTITGGVVVGCRRRGSRIQLEVWDSGVGIHPANTEKIFDEFCQLGNPEHDRQQGLGLGLAIVKRLAALLNHDIRVVSAPGTGSVFSIELPREYGNVNNDTSVVENPILRRCSIAIIDDDKNVLDGMRVLLTTWGCEVWAFSSGDEACKQLALHPRRPQIIISDLRLGESKNGIETLQQLARALDYRFTGLLITGDSDPERLREVQASGYRLLHKPVPPIKLRAFVHSTLQQSPADAPLALSDLGP